MTSGLGKSFDANANNTVLTSIRKIPVPALFDHLVSEVCKIAQREEAPGMIVGLSGTDSILSYIICLEAFKKLGWPLENVRGVNFQHETHDKDMGINRLFTCAPTDDTQWVEREILPWLAAKYPEARLEVDKSITHSKDGARWGAIHDKAKEEVNGRGDLMGTYYFPVGTRNATEHAIGGYTLITSAISFFPIKKVYKTEVIDLCRYLGVPEIAIEKSKEIDCDCGRFEIQAHNMRELDILIMCRAGLIDDSHFQDIDGQTWHDVQCFYNEETILNGFKGQTPHEVADFKIPPPNPGISPNI